MFTAPRGIILVFRGVKLSSLATRASRITFPRVRLDGNVPLSFSSSSILPDER